MNSGILAPELAERLMQDVVALSETRVAEAILRGAEGKRLTYRRTDSGLV